MAYCANCGITYPPDKRFCKECGSPLMDEPNLQSPGTDAAPTHCATCGWALPPGDRYCPNCGARVASAVSFDETMPGGFTPPPPPPIPSATQPTRQYTQPDLFVPPSEPPAAPQEAAPSVTEPAPPEYVPPEPSAFSQTIAAASAPISPEETPSVPPEAPVSFSQTMPALSEPVPPEPVVPYDAYPAAGTELPAEPSTAKKKSHLVGIVVVVAILLLGLVGGGLLVRQRIKAKRQAEQLVRQAQAALPTAPVTLAPVSETVSLDEKTKDTMGRMNAILTAVETFNGVNKKLPVSLLDLGKVMNDPATRSDAWGSPFIFLVDLSNNTFVFRSAGPDGKRDTADDIVVSDDTLTQWREQHHEVLDEWRVANLDLFQKLSGEQISSETKAALEKKKLEREKAKADAAAQQAAQLAAQQRQQQELRKQQEAAAAQAELQRQQEEARRRIEEERQQRERAEAERKARMEQMNFVETFEMNLRRWAAASFQAVTEKGKPGMRIVGFGVVRDAGDWENYTAILDVKIQKEAVNFIVRARDRQNFYFLKLTDDKTKDYPKNSLIKYIYLGGKYVTGPGSGEAQGAYAVIPLPFKIKQNDASHVVISVSGNTIRTSINGQLVDAWQDNTFKQGSFGFNCSDKEQATVTSFQMKSN